MAKLTTAEFIEAIKELSVLELNELVKACEEEFGVSSFLQLTGFYHSLPDDIARFSLPLIGNLIKRYRNDLYLNINPV